MGCFEQICFVECTVPTTIAISLSYRDSLVSSCTHLSRQAILVKVYVAFMVILNTFLGIFAGIVLVPVGEALNHQFAIFFFRKYLPQVYYLLDVIFLLSFVVAGHVVVNWANVIAYYSYLATGQVYLSIEMVKHWSAGYEDQDDDSLFYSMEYQRVVKERIRSSIIRHIELLR
jgi:hypothetical protein